MRAFNRENLEAANEQLDYFLKSSPMTVTRTSLLLTW